MRDVLTPGSTPPSDHSRPCGVLRLPLTRLVARCEAGTALRSSERPDRRIHSQISIRDSKRQSAPAQAPPFCEIVQRLEREDGKERRGTRIGIAIEHRCRIGSIRFAMFSFPNLRRVLPLLLESPDCNYSSSRIKVFDKLLKLPQTAAVARAQQSRREASALI